MSTIRFLGAITSTTVVLAIVLAAQTAPPRGSTDLLREGQQRMRDGKPDEAVAIFRRAVQASPQSFPAHNQLGVALDLTGSYADARSQFTSALELYAVVAILLFLWSFTTDVAVVPRQILFGKRFELEARQREIYARLLTNPDKYTGESAELVPGSQVRVTVQAERGSPDCFRVVSEARYPAGTTGVVMRSVTRRFRRVTDGSLVRIEVIPAGKSASR